MKVFITGGAGFIGSHLCDALVAKGEEVTILDNLSTGSKSNIAHLEGKVKVFQGDIRDKELVESLLNDSDLVFHMAAALGVDNILENTIESISTNFHGSEIVLNAASKFGKRIVIASTSEVYGKNPNQPLIEADDRVIGAPQKLRWSYSDAKALEEAIAYALFLKNDLRVTTIRFFNTVGPRQTGRYGMVIPRFVEAALVNEPLQIFGNGQQRRVFCHVNDAIKGVIALSNSDKAIGEVFNLGGIGEVSILELAKLVIDITNSKSKINFMEYQNAYLTGYEDMERRVPDINKIRKYTGWEPEIKLSATITDVVESLIKNI